MKQILLPLLAAAAFASEHVFSVHDDVLAYPQFEVVYSDSYISYDEALQKLRESSHGQSSSIHDQPAPIQSEISTYDAQASQPPTAPGHSGHFTETYELMRLKKRPYLCSIPVIQSAVKNESSEPIPEAEQRKEVARAVDKGWELLADLENRCLYYVSGWWSYSFCYNSQVKQFHQLPPSNGAPLYPPQEDHTTPAYVLGRFPKQDEGKNKAQTSKTDIMELQTKGETRYLVQQLTGGTTCDLTGKDRKVEVQFHCHPQSTDRIGFIKEVTTCTYLMVIYTPRLCNDVAFLPPRDNKPHTIACREILTPEDVMRWERENGLEANQKFLDGKYLPGKVAGDIEVGAKKLVGGDGRRIEKGKVVTPPEERAEIIAKKEGGAVRQMSKEDMKKMDIDPEPIETFRKELQEIAGDKDWRVEVVDEPGGVRHIRGVIQDDDEGEEDKKQEDSQSQQPTTEEQQGGSEEEYKEEL